MVQETKPQKHSSKANKENICYLPENELKEKPDIN